MSCEHYNKILTEEDRHYVSSEENNNCVLCLIKKYGSMTQDKIGKYLNLTKMRVNQIERLALKKFNRRIKKYL